MAKFYYGGQAVMEGVMMRGRKNMAVAVRAPSGEIIVHHEPLNNALYTNPVMRLPLLRGLVALWDALGLGTKALMFSANVALEDEAKKEADTASVDKGAAQSAAPQKDKAPAKGTDSFGPVAWTSIVVALGFMVGIFFVLPVLAAALFGVVTGNDSGLAHNLVEGVIRLALFLGYIWAIGFMPDIKRTFGYHGAEHKTINAYEAGVELTPENVQKFTLLNPRCGTTFLLIVMLLATLLFIVIGKMPFALTLVSRIVLVPVVATVAYEFIRLMANMYGNPVVRAILAPGLALQKMTTRPPDLSMLEVGIVALKAVLVADGVVQESSSTAPQLTQITQPAQGTQAAYTEPAEAS
ncbi:MAG: DUF1385 domain-containing protein [Chloroflexota bacterium]